MVDAEFFLMKKLRCFGEGGFLLFLQTKRQRRGGGGEQNLNSNNVIKLQSIHVDYL